MWELRSRANFPAGARSPFQQPHRGSRRMELQWRSPLEPPDPERLVAAEQSAGQRRTDGDRALGMAASFHRIRLRLSLQRTESERGSRTGFLTSRRNEVDHINRAGFEYQGDYSEEAWAHTTFGYRVENENGFVGDIWLRAADARSAAEQRRLLAAAGDVGQAVGDCAAGGSSTTAPLATRGAAGGADVAGPARRRDFSRDAAAVFLCHRIQRAAAGRDVRRTSLQHCESWTCSRSARGRSKRAFSRICSQGEIRLHRDLLQQSVSRPDQLRRGRSRQFRRRNMTT